MELTDGKGVDVVLNALAARSDPDGSFLPRRVRPLHRDRQTRHLPKLAHPALAAAPATPRSTSWRWTRFSSGDEELTRQMLEEIAGLVEKRRAAAAALSRLSRPAAIDAAFRLMAGGKHIGKVVVAFPDAFVPRRGESPAPGFAIKPDGCYLITGAFGGLRQGAGALAGRVRRAPSCAHEPQRRFQSGSRLRSSQELQDRGVDVRVVTADVGSPTDVTRLFAEIEAGAQPLRGVFHLAMVIDDAPLAALTPRADAHRPWAKGARRLAAARGDARNEARLLRHVLVRLEHFRQSGAGKLQRGERLPRLASRIIVRRSACPR